MREGIPTHPEWVIHFHPRVRNKYELRIIRKIITKLKFGPKEEIIKKKVNPGRGDVSYPFFRGWCLNLYRPFENFTAETAKFRITGERDFSGYGGRREDCHLTATTNLIKSIMLSTTIIGKALFWEKHPLTLDDVI